MAAVRGLLIATTSILAHCSTRHIAKHIRNDPPPPYTVQQHKKQAGSGYLPSDPMYADQQKKLKASRMEEEARRQKNIWVNIGFAFLLVGIVVGVGAICGWPRYFKSTEQPTRDGQFANSRPTDLPPLTKDGREQEWAREYQPWKLLTVAGSRVGKQAAILLFLFWEVCSWNAHHHLVLMNCRRAVLGWWVFPCEGTKAFARSFPLFAASMALIVTGRYILQYRMYYHLLLKNVLLDYTNHEIKRDLPMILVLFCFLCSVSHFILDFFFPPYVTFDKLTVIATTYFLPCFVFFILMQEASEVEKRLMPLPKFVEDDSEWATQHIAKSKKYLDTSIKHNFKMAERNLYYEKQDHRFTLDELLDEIIRMSHPVTSNFQDEPDHGEVKHGIHGLYKGLWPGRILLNPYLKDEQSKSFKKAYMTFIAVFIVVQFFLLFAFAVSAIQEARDAVPGGIPHDAFYAGGEAFEQMGFQGYCRDEGQHRPPGYFTAIAKLEGEHIGTQSTALLMRTVFGRARTNRTHQINVDRPTDLCARHCAGNEYCIGFAMDPDLCNIYTNKDTPTPSGWDTLRAIHRTSTSTKQDSHTNWAIVTTDHSMRNTCFVKLKQEREPENYLACFVYACHILIILRILYMCALKTFKSYFVSVS